MTLAVFHHFFNPTLLESLPVAVCTCDKNGYISSYNIAAKTLWGREPATGKDRFAGWWKAYRTDGTPISLEDSPLCKALSEAAPIPPEEVVIETPGGDKRIVLPHAAPLFGGE